MKAAVDDVVPRRDEAVNSARGTIRRAARNEVSKCAGAQGHRKKLRTFSDVEQGAYSPYRLDLLTDNRPGFMRMGRPFFIILVADEMVRRLQEQDRFPPGMPKQDD